MQLIGLPPNRWGIGGTPAREPSPSIMFGIKEAVFGRPDADEIVARLICGVTDAIVEGFGERGFLAAYETTVPAAARSCLC